MFERGRRWVARGLALAAGTVIGTVIGSIVLQQVAVPTVYDPVLTSSSLHVYGPPNWFPLRVPANIGCANRACGPYQGHGYWALDFRNQAGDPIMAAGAGIAHVGAVSPACAPAGTPVQNGSWVWIDHGGGVVTRYHHLNSITIADGQPVTPSTMIGTMGHSGDFEPCRAMYLHFEVRTGGVYGRRVDPGLLWACTATGAQQLPAAYGASGWDDPDLHPNPRLRTPTLTSDCVTPTWLGSPTAPTIAVADDRATVTWSEPPPRAEEVIFMINNGGRPDYVTVPLAGARRYTLSGLQSGRPYAVQAAFRNAAGTSLWSDPVMITG